jgi:hypothetical protein
LSIENFSEMWVGNKRNKQTVSRLRPHPYEFFLYYSL